MENLSFISSDEIYSCMIHELNYPHELASLFKDQIKEGLLTYLFCGEASNSLLKSDNFFLLQAFLDVLRYFTGQPAECEKITLPYNEENPFGINEATTDMNGILARDLFGSSVSYLKCSPRKKSKKPKSSSSSSQSQSQKNDKKLKKVKKDDTYMPVIEEVSDSSDSDFEPNAKSKKKKAAKVKKEIRTTKTEIQIKKQPFDENNNEHNNKLHWNKENHVKNNHPMIPSQSKLANLERSTTRVRLSDMTILLPEKFSPHIEECLDDEDQCLNILPEMCTELARYLVDNDWDVRKLPDVRAVAEAILYKYDVLYGIANRKCDQLLLEKVCFRRPEAYILFEGILREKLANRRYNVKKIQNRKQAKLLSQPEPVVFHSEQSSSSNSNFSA